jgi:predicted transcriptional regulator
MNKQMGRIPNAAKGLPTKTERITVRLDPDVARMLSESATSSGADKAAIVNQALRQYLLPRA